MSWPTYTTYPETAHDWTETWVGLPVEAGQAIVAPPGSAIVIIDVNGSYGLPHWLMEAFAEACIAPPAAPQLFVGGVLLYCVATPSQASVFSQGDGVSFDCVHVRLAQDGLVAHATEVLPPLPHGVVERVEHMCRLRTARAWEEFSRDLRDGRLS